MISNGRFDRVRFRTVVAAADRESPSAVWILEAKDVDWTPPSGWADMIADVVSGGADPEPSRVVVSGEDGRVLDVVVLTKHKGAGLIMDQHRLVSFLKDWSGSGQVAVSGQSIPVDTAKSAVVAALETHYSVPASNIDRFDSTLEPGGEYLVEVDAAGRRYVATFRRLGAVYQLHLVDRTDL